MLVIRGRLTGMGADDRAIVPAEQCTWRQVPSADGNGYKITNVEVIKGVGSLLIQGQTFGGTDPATFVADTNQLGYIGKTGRFVAQSDLL